MADKPVIPPHIKDMEAAHTKYNEADLIADTTEVDMGKLFHKSLDKIRDKNGRIDYKFFDTEKYGDKYHHLVMDDYMGELKKIVKGKGSKLSDMELGLAVEGLYGETKKAYMDTLAKMGSNFRISHYKANLAEYVKNLRGRLYGMAGEDIHSENHSAILKEVTKGKKGVFKTDLSEFAKPLFRNDIAAMIKQYYDTDKAEVTRDVIKQTEHLSQYLGKAAEQKYLHELDPKKK